MEWLYEIDKAIFLFFNAYLIHPILDAVMPRITNLSFWIIPSVPVVILFIRKEKKKALIVLGLIAVTVAISDPVVAAIIKKTVGRPRPCHPDFLVEGGRFLSGIRKSTVSFPSAHTLNMFAVATLLFCFYPKRWMFFFPFAALIGYTRVYCGVHYPFDVLGGAILGSLTGWGVYAAYIRIAEIVKRASLKTIH